MGKNKIGGKNIKTVNFCAGYCFVKFNKKLYPKCQFSCLLLKTESLAIFVVFIPKLQIFLFWAKYWAKTSKRKFGKLSAQHRN